MTVTNSKKRNENGAGKGDGYRPIDKKRYDKNYEKIFSKKGRVKS